MKLLISVFAFSFFICINLFAQSDAFYFDAVCYKGDSSLPCIDVNVIAPYQSLRFKPKDDFYYTKYNIIISIYDTLNNLVGTEKIKRTIKADNYFESIGGNSKFDAIQKRFYLNSGFYKVVASVQNEFDNMNYEKYRNVKLIDFAKHDYSLSGVALISSIEEKANGGYIITPHLSDNIGVLNNFFFVFFESYSKINDSVDYFYEIFNSKNEKIYSNKSSGKIEGVGRNFFRIEPPKTMPSEKNILRISLTKKSDKSEPVKEAILAQAERALNNKVGAFGVDADDIDKYISYLAYVANQDEMDYMKSGSNNIEKYSRFQEFWAKLDPSPGTNRNEAFDEYFARIDYANKRFRSHSQGWLSDMGKVFIIYGAPSNTERKEQMNRTLEYWTYGNGKQFIFVDNSNFGYFELSYPLSSSEKYKYRY